jgi:hypothetical protein
MSKTTMEVEVVRYFESAPIESAEIVYRIVADKMESRLSEKSPTPNRAGRRRSPKEAAEQSQQQNGSTKTGVRASTPVVESEESSRASSLTEI